MTDEEIRAFLALPLLGVVGTIRKDGRPHAVPVWYRHVEDSTIRIWTEENRAWVAHARRDPRVTFAVYDATRPLSGAVIISGTASFEEIPDATKSEDVRKITERYAAEDKVDYYINLWDYIKTIVTIKSDKVTGWTGA
ncbi:MAG: pyridoxamine 5'-phosphate oxidase family protein [Dehalococcoidia bacterium]